MYTVEVHTSDNSCVLAVFKNLPLIKALVKMKQILVAMPNAHVTVYA